MNANNTYLVYRRYCSDKSQTHQMW